MNDSAPDRIALSGLKVFGYHGVYDFERRQGQDFVVDVVLRLDLRKPAASDDVADTVHYGELAEAVAERVAGVPVNLLERLADDIARICLGYRIVDAVDVTVHKPQAPIEREFADVQVTITRARRDFEETR